jgi:hypothetical protein
MEERPLTPRERIESRRKEREFRRSFLKHHRCNPWRFWALVADYLAWVKFLAIAGHFRNLIQLLKVLALIPKFCNDLIGVSLTDSLPAPAIN